MKVAFSVKNSSKAVKPSQNDVLLFDGQEWYITTKEDLLKDAYKLIEQCKEELANLQEENNNLKMENANFKREMAIKMKKLSELVEKLYTSSEVN